MESVPTESCYHEHQNIEVPLKFDRDTSGMLKVLQYFLFQPRFHRLFNKDRYNQWRIDLNDTRYADMTDNEKIENALFKLSVTIEDFDRKKCTINAEEIIGLMNSCSCKPPTDPKDFLDWLLTKTVFNDDFYIGRDVRSEKNVFSFKIQECTSTDIVKYIAENLKSDFKDPYSIVLTKAEEKTLNFTKYLHIRVSEQDYYYINEAAIYKNNNAYALNVVMPANIMRIRYKKTDNISEEEHFMNQKWSMVFYRRIYSDDVPEGGFVQQELTVADVKLTELIPHEGYACHFPKNVLDPNTYPVWFHFSVAKGTAPFYKTCDIEQSNYHRFNAFMSNALNVMRNMKSFSITSIGQMNYQLLREKIFNEQQRITDEQGKLEKVIRLAFDTTDGSIDSIIKCFQENEIIISEEEISNIKAYGNKKKSTKDAGVDNEKDEEEEEEDTTDRVEEEAKDTEIDASTQEINTEDDNYHIEHIGIDATKSESEGKPIVLPECLKKFDWIEKANELDTRDNLEHVIKVMLEKNLHNSITSEAVTPEPTPPKQNFVNPDESSSSDTEISDIEKEYENKKQNKDNEKTEERDDQNKTNPNVSPERYNYKSLIEAYHALFIASYTENPNLNAYENVKHWRDSYGKMRGFGDKYKQPEISTLMEWRRQLLFPSEPQNNDPSQSKNQSVDEMLDRAKILTMDTYICVLVLTLYYPLLTAKQKAMYVKHHLMHDYTRKKNRIKKDNKKEIPAKSSEEAHERNHDDATPGLNAANDSNDGMNTELSSDFDNMTSDARTANQEQDSTQNEETPIHENTEKKYKEEENIPYRSIQRCIQSMGFRQKTSTAYIPHRNSEAAVLLRGLWAEKMLEIAENPNSLLCFVDEAAIETNSNNKMYMSYKGMHMHAKKNIKGVHISFVACVIPCFGVSLKFTLGGVKKGMYNEFIKNNSQYIRDYIGCEKTEVFFINDNASIHKELEKEEKSPFSMIFTIPYSPQTNAPAENFFGIIKSEYDKLGIDFNANTDPRTVLLEVQNIIKNIVKSKIQDIIKISYYEHIINIWNDCKNLKPLIANKVDSNVELSKKVREIETRRIKGTTSKLLSSNE